MPRSNRSKTVFVDTSFLIALSLAKDKHRERARQFLAENADAKLITCDEVLSEFISFFSSLGKRYRHLASRTARGYLDGDLFEVLPQSRETLKLGLSLYDSRPDKGYSLVDCVQMQHMRSRQINTALTLDLHFQQEGFECPLRDKLDAV